MSAKDCSVNGQITRDYAVQENVDWKWLSGKGREAYRGHRSSCSTLTCSSTWRGWSCWTWPRLSQGTGSGMDGTRLREKDSHRWWCRRWCSISRQESSSLLTYSTRRWFSLSNCSRRHPLPKIDEGRMSYWGILRRRDLNFYCNERDWK